MTTFDVGQLVVLRSQGVAEITEITREDAWNTGHEEDWLILRAGDQPWRVRVSDADQLIRPLASRSTAEEMLDILRNSEVKIARRPDVPVTDREREVIRSGTPLQHAQLLRDLYGAPGAVSVERQVAAGMHEQRVLQEIAAVLGLNEQLLRAEFAERHPDRR